MIDQRPTLESLGAEVLLVAYDRPSLLAAKIMRGLEVGYRLLLDRTKEAYRDWGLGRTTLTRSVLSPTLTWRYIKLLVRGERFLGVAPDMLQLGGDFVVDREGRLAFAHRMRDNGDRAPVAAVLAALRRVAGVAFALLALLAGPVGAQGVETGFLDRAVTLNGTSHRYQVYVPAEYPGRTDWPVILFLHGAGERGRDGLLQTTVGLGPAIRRAPQRFPAIVVFPQAPPDSQWVGAPAEMALAALTQIMGEYRVDPDRVYLTGLSMGGHGTWYLAYRHAERFAAVAPICGWVVDLPRFEGSVPVVPPDSGAAVAALARRLARTPTWIFHGEMDPVVPVDGSRAPAAALKAASADVRYTEFLGLDHNSWDATYASDEFTRWLFAQRRN